MNIVRFQLACCLLIVGCDQFAQVGVLQLAKNGDMTAGQPASMHDAAAGPSAGETTPSSDAGMPLDSACVAPAVAVCDPILNEGCPAALRMQCAVDFTSDVLAGYCIFQGPPAPDGSAVCLNTVATESCGPSTTCVFGTCRRLCFCDAQCGAEECCSEPIGDLGFKVCGACA